MQLRPDDAARLAGDLLNLETNFGTDPESGLVGVSSGPSTLPGGRLGNYRITRLVGSGGMGEVYEAEQENPRRRVALKVVRSHLLSPELRRRFEHEVRILGSLQHPGIAQIYEAGQFGEPVEGDARPFFAMEYVEGEPLTKYAAARKLPVRERLELFLRVCQAVEHAHQRGIIHRDLKPANILVESRTATATKSDSALADSIGQPKILDFGVARATDADVTVTSVHTEMGKLVGTLPYMSPEQASGDSADLDMRSDVYAMGVVLYELLSGKLPYEVKGDGRARVAEALRVIKEVDPTPLSSIDRVFRGDLETIVAKALEKERERRYQSVGELAGDVRRYLADEPIVARRVGAWYELRKFARRNRGVASLAGALFIVLVISSGLLARLALLESRARTREREQRVAAEGAKDRAEQHYQKMLGVTHFLTEVLRGAQAEIMPSQETTVLQAVDRAIGAMGSRFAGEPEVESWIRDTAGHVYKSYGRLEDAEKQYRASIKLNTGLTGKESEPLWGAMSNLAAVLQQMGRLDEALEVCEAAIAGAESQPGVDEELILSMKLTKAWALQRMGRSDEASDLLTAVAERRAQLLGEEHPDTISAYSYLAKQALEKRQSETAERWARRAKESLAKGGGANLREETEAANLLACALHQLGRLQEAADQFRECIENGSRLNGPEAPSTLSMKNNLAMVLLDQGDFVGAADLMQSVIESHKRAGSDRSQVVHLIANLASVKKKQGDHAAAEALFREVVEEVKDSEEHLQVSLARFNLARCLYDQKKYAVAAPEFALACERSALLPPDHSVPGVCLREYGKCLYWLERYDEAEQALLKSEAMLESAFGLGHDRTQAAVDALSKLYEKIGRPEAAAEWKGKLKPRE